MSKKTTQEFIEKSRLVHGDKYDYSISNYQTNHTKISIICSIHGEFLQTPINHYKGKGCYFCNGNPRKTISEFIKESNEIHNNKYDYSLVDYKNNKIKVKIICKKHGVFEQSPAKHIFSSQGCPMCNLSKGENKISSYLINNNIDFISQKKFEDCKNKLQLPFDFYLPKYNVCIEYDGLQHFETSSGWGGSSKLEKTKTNDKIKSKFCEDSNIPLLRISYINFESIETTIGEYLENNKKSF